MHNTKSTGDIAVAEVTLLLLKKDYWIFTPLISEHCPYDLIVEGPSGLHRIQVKAREDGSVPIATSWVDKHGNHRRLIDVSQFDYYAIYHPSTQRIAFLPSNTTIRKLCFASERQAHRHMWMDYASLSSDKILEKTPQPITVITQSTIKKKSLSKESILNSIEKYGSCKKAAPHLSVSPATLCKYAKQHAIDLSQRTNYKIDWPTRDELKSLLEGNVSYSKIASDLGVSDNAVRRHLKRLGIHVVRK